MIMLRLTQTEDFKTINSSCSTKEQVQKASENFMKRIITLCDAEDNAISLFRILRYTRFRLQTLQEKYLMDGEGKNVLELLSVIDTELELLKVRMQGLLPALPVKPAKKLRWTGKATDLVELLYALDTCDCINNGEIGVEELADVISEIFGVEIKNCYNVYMNMKRRKDGSRTYFLDELREKLNKRMVESDLKGGKFKKR
ncbi:RteC protein [Tannerella forsythia]|nr:RteC protein [Tannerella forsythia]